MLAFALDATAVPEGIVSLGEFSCMNFRSEDAHNLFPSTLNELKAFSMWNSQLSLPSVSITKSGYIGTNIKTIGEYAFAKAELRGQYAFNKVTEMGIGAFCGAEWWSLDTIDFMSLKELPEKAFAYSDGGYLYFSSAFKKIGKEAFMESYNSTQFHGTFLPQIIEDRAFKGARNEALASKYLEKIEYIGEEAFQAKRYYVEMKIPASCTYIGNNAFYKKVKLLVEPGSYAESWARDNGYEYDNGIEQDLSWLGQN